MSGLSYKPELPNYAGTVAVGSRITPGKDQFCKALAKIFFGVGPGVPVQIPVGIQFGIRMVIQKFVHFIPRIVGKACRAIEYFSVSAQGGDLPITDPSVAKYVPQLVSK